MCEFFFFMGQKKIDEINETIRRYQYSFYKATADAHFVRFYSFRLQIVLFLQIA